MAANILGLGDGALMIREEVSTESLATIYPTLPQNVPSRAAVADDFAGITHLRFDTVTACNARCLFCHSDFSGDVRHLEPAKLAEAIAFPMPKLYVISAGCAYEPLMGKHFEKYPAQLASLKGKIQARIITNGFLLHKRDLTPWVELGLEYVHLSIHGHTKAEYEFTMKGAADFDQLCDNLRQTRRRFPELKLQPVIVLNKANSADVRGFCRWAFDDVGAFRVILFRGTFAERPPAGAPVLPGYALSDDEWARVLDSCADLLAGIKPWQMPGLDRGITTLTIDAPAH